VRLAIAAVVHEGLQASLLQPFVLKKKEDATIV